MSSRNRQLSPQEADLWARLARTVKPLRRNDPFPDGMEGHAKPIGVAVRPGRAPSHPQSRTPQQQPSPGQPPRSGDGLSAHGLDAGWDRRLARGVVSPDFTLDLHGCTLDQAHARLEHGLTLAASQGARLVLLVTGRHRPSDDHAGRSERRGAIRAKVADWLAAGSHASRIAAVRPAHPRHGGAGALYLVLRRRR